MVHCRDTAGRYGIHVNLQREQPQRFFYVVKIDGEPLYLALQVFDLAGDLRAFGDHSRDYVRESFCCAILRPMGELGMVAVWLIIIMVTAVAGIVTDSPTTAVIVGILAAGLGGLLVVRRQPE
jgi:hypothetical protein